MSNPDERDNIQIIDVWKDNIKEEFRLIGEVVDKYPYVSLDTEFAGTIFRGADYKAMKKNVKHSKLIQVGLTLSDDKGCYSASTTDEAKQYVWQFNFGGFDPNQDVCAKESIKLLTECGIDFNKNYIDGMNGSIFGELLMSSGLVLNDEIQWITFQGCLDFGYLLSILTGKDLPETKEEFFEVLGVYFPNFYDIKFLMNFTNNLHGGLENVARALGAKRDGKAHQAGSDSLLTSRVFMELKKDRFNGAIPETHRGVLYIRPGF